MKINLFCKRSTKILSFLILLFFVSPSIVNASPTCEKTALQSTLIKMNFDPEITTNEELLAEIEANYGSEAAFSLENEHKYLEKKEGIFNLNSLEWVEKRINEQIYSRYLLILNDLTNEKVMQAYIIFMYQAVIDKSDKVALIFPNKDTYQKLFLYTYEHFNRIVSEKYPKLTPDELSKNKAVLFRKLLNIPKENVLYGFDKIKHKNPVITIDGHGIAGKEAIKIGDIILSASQIVQKLKELKLPDDAVLDLQTCYSASHIALKKTSKSSEELKTAFHLGNLPVLAESKKSNLMTGIMGELVKEIPSFSGSINGYIGEISVTSLKNVHTVKGAILPAKRSSRIRSFDKQFFYVKLKDVQVKLTSASLDKTLQD